MELRIVLVTTNNQEEARKIAQAVLEARLAACVNILPAVESHFWWQGQLSEAKEILLLVKSSMEHHEALTQTILRNHSYACPEIVTLSPDQVSPAYRQWWEVMLAELQPV